MRRRSAFLIGLWFAQLILASPSAAQKSSTSASSEPLVKLVILSRHGVRAPILTKEELAPWTASKWPTWTCPPNDEERMENANAN